jgi:hypothetical protein
MRPRREPIDVARGAAEDEMDLVVQEAERISHPPRVRTSAVDTVAGMAAGAIAGALAGPPGVVAGIVLGGAAGAVAGFVAEGEERERTRHDEELDTEIGVFGGPLGEVRSGTPSLGGVSAADPADELSDRFFDNEDA